MNPSLRSDLEELCTCFPVENPWTYYGIIEPGGAYEPNPECPVHFPGRWKVACINWSWPSAPHAVTYLDVDGGAVMNRYWPTWGAAIAYLNEISAYLEEFAVYATRNTRARANGGE